MNKVNKDTFKTLKKVLNIIWTYDERILFDIIFIDTYTLVLTNPVFKIYIINNSIKFISKVNKTKFINEIEFILNSHFQIQEAINE